ncbi:T9SS type A sorting domain-containing protein [Mucilaginibacter psychrotolerans]|uniref:T9SS type A sorting domain-containing protein n=1 Tax=Mucilaginibacter psychrotolerans TaxID=1524096 RepID=UPI001057D091|nr:T9SS type A sorting domain-containing protein [Mucilaginibacter psychrotolerans]
MILFNSKVSAQETSDNSTYYYNNFESASAGTISSLGASGVGNATRPSGGTSVTIDASTTSPLDGSVSLESKSLSAIGAIRWDFVGNGTSGVSLSANDFEWNFVYKNTTTSSNDDPDVMTAGNNSWRYWLIANGYTTNNMQGFYVSHVGTSLVLRYRYDTGNQAGHYNSILSATLPNDQNAYMIKIQRLRGGTWAIYMDRFVAGMTTAKTLVTISSDNTGSGYSTYYYSYLEATSTTLRRFQFDKFDMYTRVLTFVGANSAANGITPTPYTEDQTVIYYGLQVQARGNFAFGSQLYLTSSGSVGLNDYFVSNTGGFWESNDSFFSTSTDHQISSSVQLSGNGTGAVQVSGFADTVSTSGNTDGTLSVPQYYFFTGTTKSQLNYGKNPTGTFTLTAVGRLFEQPNNSQTGISITSSGVTSGTISFANSVDWKGTNSSDWSTGTNWSSGSTPTSSQIPRVGVVAFTNQPTSTNGGTFKAIRFGSASGAITLTMQEDLTLTNGFSLDPSATVSIVGGSKTLNVNGGTIVLNPLSSLSLSNLTFTNSASSFNLLANSSGSASIGQLTNVTLGGSNFVVQKYIKGSSNSTYRAYRFLSSPVYASAQTLNGQSRNVYGLGYLTGSNGNFPILTGAASGGFNRTGNPTLYLYREDRKPLSNAFSGGNYIGISSIASSPSLSFVDDGTTFKKTSGYLPVGNGFAMFYRGSTSSLSARVAFPNPTAPDDVTLSATGALNQGSIPVTLWYSQTATQSYQHTLGYNAVTGNSGVRGFNLVGNPYPSTIDWEQLSYTTSTAGIYAPPATLSGSTPTSNYVSKTYYIYNPASKNFETYTQGASGTGSATRYIPSGQGFFVRVMPEAGGGTTTLTFNETAKASTQQVTAFLGLPNETISQSMRLKLVKDSVNTDDILMYFKTDGSNVYDPFNDAEDLGGISAQVSLSNVDSAGHLVAFKNLPPLAEGNKFKISVNATTTGIYQLQGSEFETLNKRYDTFLLDHYKQDSLLISTYKVYNFNIDKSVPATFGADRFEIVFHKKNLPPYSLLQLTASKALEGAKVVWKVDNEFDYTKFELQKLDTNGVYVPIYDMASNNSGTYSFTDKNFVLGSNVYRLKQTDIDNNISYSKEVKLMYSEIANGSIKLIKVFPNPTGVEINVSMLAQKNSGSYSISIINSSGRVVKQASFSEPYWSGNIEALPPGIYIIQVNNKKDNSVVGRSKFIKL